MKIEIAKFKGCKGSSYEQQEKLLAGDKFNVQVTQFISGKNCYMKDQEIEGRVYVKEVSKKISQYDDDGNCKYSKGIIQEQNVLPHLFIEGVKQ